MCAKLFGSVYGNVLYSVSYLLLRVSGQVFRFCCIICMPPCEIALPIGPM